MSPEQPKTFRLPHPEARDSRGMTFMEGLEQLRQMHRALPPELQAMSWDELTAFVDAFGPKHKKRK